jgi:hypothetical protein
MKSSIRALLILGLPTLGLAQSIDQKSARTASDSLKKTADAFVVQEKSSGRPFTMERDCPSPDLFNAAKSSHWQTLELGLSFPVGMPIGEFRIYSRYTCPAPRSP